MSMAEIEEDRFQLSKYSIGKCIAMRPNRVSFTFDLTGPSMILDTGMFGHVCRTQSADL